jgi:hypothetical protein
MVEYKTFDDWFNEIEHTAFRSERFFDHLEMIIDNEPRRTQFLINWLRAAFESGRNPEDKYI